MTEMALPSDVRALLDAPNYAHLSTVRADGSPRNHVVWVGREGDRLLVCTSEDTWKAQDMRHDPRVSVSVVDSADPYRMAAIQGRVVEIRADHDCRFMDPIAMKYTGKPFPSRGPDRVCFVIAPVKAAARNLPWFRHDPACSVTEAGGLVDEVAAVIARFVASTDELTSAMKDLDATSVRQALDHLTSTRRRALALVGRDSSSGLDGVTRAGRSPSLEHESASGEGGQSCCQ